MTKIRTPLMFEIHISQYQTWHYQERVGVGLRARLTQPDHRPKKGESIAMGLHLMMMQRELLNFQHTLAESFPTTKNAEFPGRIAFVRYVPAIWYEGLFFPHPAVYKKILLDVYTWTRV